MLSEAITKLQELVEEQKRLRIIPELTTSEFHYLDNGQGNLIHHERLPRDRNHQVGDLASLIEAIKLYCQRGSACWVAMDAVRAILDDRDLRVNTITLPLSPHEAFDVLGEQPWLEQRPMIDLIRHRLADCQLYPEWTLDSLRTMRFSAGQEQTGKHDDHSAALGKSITAEVTGAENLPKTVQVEFHPWPALAEDLDVSVTVHCTLFTDAVACRLQLAPQPGQIELAQRKAQLALQALIRDALDGTLPDGSECGVLIGRP